MPDNSTSEEQRLYEGIVNSSSKNRNLFIFYLLFVIYVAVIVFSTTDLQLLMPTSSIDLPFVSLAMPVGYFYALVPVLVLAFFVNLCHNASEHMRKLSAWKQHHQQDGSFNDSMIQPALLDYATLGSSDYAGFIRLAYKLLALYSAPALLALMLIWYADYQSIGFTAWHTAALYLSVAVIVMYQRRIKHFSDTQDTAADNPSRITIAARSIARQHAQTLTLVFHAFALLPFTLLCLLAFEFPTSLLKTADRLSFLPTIAIDANLSVVRLDTDELQLRQWQEKSTDKAETWHQYGKGWDLRQRNLRFANLAGVNLGKANLAGAQLYHAKLNKAYLLGAQLEKANLAGANNKRRESDVGGSRLRESGGDGYGWHSSFRRFLSRKMERLSATREMGSPAYW